MLRTTRKIPAPEKLNLTPIMDAVFIFIFFLIFSSQFVKLFEIESETPLVREVPHDQTPDTPPLNLIINITSNSIEITTGLDRKSYKTILRSKPDAENKLKELVLKLRKSHPDDDYAIISPASNISYDEIVKYIDVIQKLPDGIKELELPQAKKIKRVSKIYGQIVLEPLKDET